MDGGAAGRVRVKICGLTCREDAEMAIACGADALGFNLWPGSKRFVSLAENADWIAGLPPMVTKVAVVVNLSLDEARSVAAHPAIDMVQFHGDESAEYCAEFARLGVPFIKALRVGEGAGAEKADGFSTRNILLDSSVPGQFGGTGAKVDLELARAFLERFPGLRVILAGGLTPENVAEAVAVVRPYAVDVASGVEGEPRRKHPGKTQEFIVRAAGR